MILAIDTATAHAGIALYDGEAVLLEHAWHSFRNHTVELMPNVMRALTHQRQTPRDLTAVTVALGPGSFTGLRIGLGVAKGMAFASKIPVLGIPTLDIIGYAYARLERQTCAVIKAGRKRLCTATYVDEDGLQRLDDYRIVSRDELITGIDQPTWFYGELDTSLRKRLRYELGELAHLPSPAASLRRAGYLAEMGWQRLERGERDNLATLSPIYLNNPAGSKGA
jgi:tRNA threonylcarbamoyladenosine biosynthesis protein TsaB